MKTATLRLSWAVALVAALVLSVMFVLPRQTSAVGTAADAMCNPVDVRCPCNQVMTPKGCKPGVNWYMCPNYCTDNTNNFTTKGVCIGPNKCQGTSTSGQNGGMGDLKQALDAVKSILDMMKGQGGGGGSSGGSGTGVNGTNPTLGGCATYYNVTTPSSDPCAVYIPPVSDTLGSTTGSSAANDLISSLLGGSYGTNNTTQTTQTNQTQTTQTTQTTNTTGTQSSSTTTGSTYAGGVPALVPGVSGDIQYSSSSVTVLVNNVDDKTGTQVAGFYGTDAGGQPTGIISTMCQGRPWATNFLSFIIPATFFDSLCELRGYKVGTVVAAAPPTHTATPVKVTKPATTTPPVATSTGPYVEPQADIWAVPAKVPLGARTTVFWNAKGVTSCDETSPDGSFSQHSLSGGAATVPLSGATTYTISCLTPAGDHITNYVTVNLSAN